MKLCVSVLKIEQRTQSFITELPELIETALFTGILFTLNDPVGFIMSFAFNLNNIYSRVEILTNG